MAGTLSAAALLCLGAVGEAPATDPFAGRTVGDAAYVPPVPLPPDAQTVVPLPPTQNAATGQPGDRVRSDALLRGARRALAVGDVRQAADMVGEAKRLHVRYAPGDDSPEKVDAAIAKHQEITALDKGSEAARRAYARMLMEQAEALFQWGDLDPAEQLASQAARQQVVYGPLEPRPEELLNRIARLRQQGSRAVQDDRRSNILAAPKVTLFNGEQAFAPDNAAGPPRPAAGAVLAAGGAMGPDAGATRAYYDSERDTTRNIPAADQEPAGGTRLQLPAEVAEPIPTPLGRAVAGTEVVPATPSPGYALFQQGEAALRAHDVDRAYDLYRQAAAYMNDMDPVTAQRLQDHLQLLSAARKPAVRPGGPGSAVDEAAAQQHALLRKVALDLANVESNAHAIREKDPKAALAMLEDMRKKIEASALEPAARDRMLRQVDRNLAELRQFIEQNRPRIELAERNEQTRQDIARAAQVKEETQKKIAELVDKYNQLFHEQRYPEARVVVKQVTELAPNDPIAELLRTKSELQIAIAISTENKEEKEKGILAALEGVDKTDILPADEAPVHYPGDWRPLTERRQRLTADRQRHGSERDLEIEKKLRTQVSVAFHNKPLNQVLEQLAKLADVNIHLDENGLSQEGVLPETPVTLELGKDIMLKSALNLILEPKNLCFVIQDEVLKITSKEMKAGQTYVRTYQVGDLVMPIPNFVANPNMGLAGAYHQAMSNAGMGGGGLPGTLGTPLAVVASRDGTRQSAAINPNMLAQISSHSAATGGGAPPNLPMGFGPGGAGGGNQPDFDDLIELITTTVAPKTWDTNGGAGTIDKFPTNLSLVVTQTQEVHEQIVDLLDQLRRMQDLQVTIEVRFITLSDDFFERIGVDFDFNIRSNTANPQSAGFTAPFVNTAGLTTVQHNGVGPQTSIVGLQPGTSNNPASTPTFTSNLDIPFTQGSYSQAVPQFGGSAAAFGSGAQIGFAVLSDIEAYFFINAAQGDARTNVLQAPKVTLFNGQQAFVSDTSQTPFVISAIPVVADFVAAQQPVIVVLSEGTFMTVQAVVSNDRRFVRLTIVPFFSKIGNVQTFTFQGSNTTTTDTTRQGLLNPATSLFDNNHDINTTTNSGVTVQLPTFSFVTVTTTVSVPDGGTVLLGGIKRLSEDREEFGVPILDKIPYLNRLFKNVGIGRSTSSLLMMVTPRIIIEEEEEANLGIAPTP
jgi:general secretion pathway protein D